jgi:type IV secretory pathway VirB4 component
LDKLSGETKQEGLTLNEQEAGELLKSLNKLSNHPKESRRDSLKLNDQEADELLKALDKLSPEQLKQVQTKSETIQITDEQLDQLINDLKSMDVDEPSESVASKLRMNHVGSGSSTQKQPLGERPKLRDAFPELVPDQGQKKEGPKQGSLRV